MGGLLFFAPGASRVSPRRASYFFLRRQKKVTKKKGEPRPCRFAVPCATRSVRGTCKLASLKQCKCLHPNAASVAQHVLMAVLNTPRLVRFANFARMARPLRELRPNGSSASRTSPEWLVRFANFAECWGFLISHASLLSRARHAVPLQPSKTAAVSKLRHSARSRGIHVSQHSNLDAATTRSMTACAGHRCPHHPHHSPSFLTPTTSPLPPHLLTPHSSLLPPHSSLLTPHSYDLTPPSR